MGDPASLAEQPDRELAAPHSSQDPPSADEAVDTERQRRMELECRVLDSIVLESLQPDADNATSQQQQEESDEEKARKMKLSKSEELRQWQPLSLSRGQPRTATRQAQAKAP